MTRMLRTVLMASAAAGMALAAGPMADGVITAEPLGGQQQVDEIALTLSNPGAHPRLGVPDFVMPQGDPTMVANAKTVAEVLWDDLDFEREYYLIPRATSTTIPVTPVAAIPYGTWAAAGADFVLHGNAYPSGDTLVVELRLVSVRGQNPGSQHFGKRYQCGMQSARGPRDCAHQIADDFHMEVRKVPGVARTKLAFTSDRDSGRVSGRPSQSAAVSKEIYISDYDGANQIRLTANRIDQHQSVLVADGGLLAYTSLLVRLPGHLRREPPAAGPGPAAPGRGHRQRPQPAAGLVAGRHRCWRSCPTARATRKSGSSIATAVGFGT